MLSETRTCPYCNSLVTVPEAVGGSRFVCPRCGESFPVRLLPSENGRDEPAPSTATVLSESEPDRVPHLLEPTRINAGIYLAALSVLVIAVSLTLRLTGTAGSEKAFPFMVGVGALGLVASIWLWYFRRPRTNGATAGFILGNMLAMALLILPYALSTERFRRGNDPPARKPLAPAGPVRSVPEAKDELASLGYLPADSNLIVAIHLGQTLQSPAGKTFLEDSSWGPLELALRQVELWTKLKKEAIDHIALGMPGDWPPLRLTIAVRTREPYDPKSFAIDSDASRRMEYDGRSLFPLQIKPFGHGAIWCVEERTLLLALRWDGTEFQDLKASLPKKPRAGPEGLSPWLWNGIEELITPDTPIWIAGDQIAPAVMGILLPFPRASKDGKAPLEQVEDFIIGLRFREDAALFGELECADEKGAKDIFNYVKSQTVKGAYSLEVAEPVVRRKGKWRVSFQVRAAPEMLRQLLRSKGK